MLSNGNLNIDVVGGVPTLIKSSNKFESKVCAEIMESSYLYFFPKHRNTNYTGFSSSIYLGCFSTKFLQKIRFNEIEALIKEALPEATVTITDLAGDGNHYAAEVIDESFRGKNRVQQQRVVYSALKGKMDGSNGELHALALTTKIPEG